MLNRFTPERLETCFRDLGLEAPAGLFEELRTAYAEPQRAYHTAQHIDECLGTLDLAERNAPVELALWFHDAIYDPRGSGNEERSADWAARVLAMCGASESLIEQVKSLILATRHTALPTTRDEQLLVDVDLSILGAPPERFREYEAQVRIEYSWVPEDAFRAARAGILRSFLERPSIYSTRLYRDLFEEQARANLAASLTRHALC